MKWGLLMLCFMGVAVIAEPIVIRDYGGQASGVPDKATIARSVMNTPLKPVSKIPITIFPLRSTLRSGELTAPTKLANKVHYKNPYFIIGNDERSRDWVAENKEYLVKIHAKGLATNIASEGDFKALEAFVAPLVLAALPIDEFAQSLGLRVYPILITNEEIAQ